MQGMCQQLQEHVIKYFQSFIVQNLTSLCEALLLSVFPLNSAHAGLKKIRILLAGNVLATSRTCNKMF